MTVNANIATTRNSRDVLGKLAPLGQIEGVRDFLLVGRQGAILAAKPGSTWGQEVASACAADIAQVGEILSFLSEEGRDERVFDFQFKATLLMACDLGSTYLLVLCSKDTNLAIVRMTVNIIKEELGKDRRFRNYLARRGGQECLLLNEQRVPSEMCKHLVALKHR